ncbi:MAG: hypothetical protein IPL26_11055 [Leptospiraceae bacterium]|nr:hypothetical protein [Leptospiraceae bacterium]
MFIKLIRATLLILTILLTEGCSAFVIKHVDASGKSQTYITNTVFVGTGTFLDCFISPFHWFAGIFYKQPYVHVQGGNLSYPSFGASGCFASSYTHGNGILGGLGIINLGYFKENPSNAIFFTDIESKERAIIGGNFEAARVTKNINFNVR